MASCSFAPHDIRLTHSDNFPSVFFGWGKSGQDKKNEEEMEDSEWETASEDEEDAQPQVDWELTRSLFDNHLSQSFESNLEYMWKKFGELCEMSRAGESTPWAVHTDNRCD